MGHAILHFLWAQTWGAILVIAFMGFGYLALRCLIGRVPSIGLAACVGLSLAVFLGGLLNLLHLIVAGVLIGFTLVGVGLAIGQILRPGRDGLPAEATAGLLPGARLGVGSAWRCFVSSSCSSFAWRARLAFSATSTWMTRISISRCLLR